MQINGELIVGLVIGGLIVWWIMRNRESSGSETLDRFQSKVPSRPPESTESQPPDTLPPITTKVVGVTYDGRQSVVASLFVGEQLELIQEPDNPHDPKAIKVVRMSGQQVGYVDRELAKDIAWHFSSIAKRYADVVKLTGNARQGQSLGVVIRIYQPSVAEMIMSDDYRHPW